MTFSLWTNAGGALLVDDTGAPIWCETCPCDGYTELTCGDSTFILPAGTQGYWSATLTGFTNCTQFNATIVWATGANWGCTTSGGTLGGQPYSIGGGCLQGSLGVCYHLVRIVIGASFISPKLDITWQLDHAPASTVDFRSPVTIPVLSSNHATASPSACQQATPPGSITLQALPL